MDRGRIQSLGKRAPILISLGKRAPTLISLGKRAPTLISLGKRAPTLISLGKRAPTFRIIRGCSFAAKGFSLWLGLLMLAHSSALLAKPYDLSDTDPNSSEYKKKFLGTYGINADIEPKLEQKDRPLYESILPYLQEDPKKAIQMVESNRNPDQSAAFDFLLGNLYYSIGDFNQSIEKLRIAIKKMPSFRRAWRTLALSQVQLQEFTDSIASWLKVISLGGGDAQSYSLLGYAYLTNEKYHSALKAYEMARMYNPDSKDIRQGEAQCLLMTLQYDRAISLFDELIQEEPNNEQYWLFQVNAFLAKEQYASAISNLEIIRSIGKANWQNLNLLGNLYLSEQNFSLALESHKAALTTDLSTDEEDALEPLRSFVRLGHYELAFDYLQLYLQLRGEPTKKELRLQKDILLARIQLANPEYGKGVETLRSVLKQDPLNGTALILLGEHEMEQEDFAQSEFYLERASNLEDFKVDAWIGLGRLYVNQSKFEKALKFLKKAERLKKSISLEVYIRKVEAIAGRL